MLMNVKYRKLKWLLRVYVRYLKKIGLSIFYKIKLFAHLNRYIACLFSYLYPINLKTTEPIWSKFCMWPHMTPGKVYGWSK